MKVFEFKQIESGSNFRIEIDYHHYMQKQTAWLDGDILEMGEKPLELVNARLYVDDELKYSSNVVSGYDLKLSEDIRTIKGYKVRTVHALKLAIINPEVWEKYEEWLEEVIKDGTEPEVKEFQKREKEKAAAEELEYAKEVVSLAESQKDIPSREEARRRMKWWNDTYNEGGEGFVPTIINIEQYKKAKNVIARHKEDEIPVFQSKGIGDYKVEDTVYESKDLDL